MKPIREAFFLLLIAILLAGVARLVLPQPPSHPRTKSDEHLC